MDFCNLNCLFQYSGIEAFNLLEYDGSMTISDLEKYGNFGLGCFNALNGELIAFDNQFFHATSDGSLKPARSDSLVSCVYMTYFQSQHSFKMEKSFNMKVLQDFIKPIFSLRAALLCDFNIGSI